jgi:hypothetical protein
MGINPMHAADLGFQAFIRSRVYSSNMLRALPQFYSIVHAAFLFYGALSSVDPYHMGSNAFTAFLVSLASNNIPHTTMQELMLYAWAACAQ